VKETVVIRGHPTKEQANKAAAAVVARMIRIHPAMKVKKRGRSTSVLLVIDAVRKRPNAMENDPVMLARRSI
jgi:hypothetical protein